MMQTGFRTTFVVGVIISLAAWLPAAGAAENGVTVLFTGDDLERFEPDEEDGTAGRMSVVELEGPGFRRALRLSGESGGRFRVRAPLSRAIGKGEVLSLSFHVRGAGGEDAQVRFEPGISRWSSPMRMAVRVSDEWRKYEYPFRTRRGYEAGESRIEFLTGRGAIEIGSIQLASHGVEADPLELPCTRLEYAGSEPDAGWRAAAAERIERLRKGDLTVRVRDGSGRPVAGAEVTVQMKRHAFGFGSVINVPTFQGKREGVSEENLAAYKHHILRLFDRAVFESATKWPQWEREETPAMVLDTLEWLHANGLDVRGHVLVWPSWRWLPERLKELKNDPAALRREVREHIRDELTQLRGKFVDWDVINEPYSNHDLIDILGRGAMVEWFELAREFEPNAKLYLNDYSILAGNDDRHRDHFEETIRFLIEHDAPIDGIGMQAHFGSEVTPPVEVLEILDRFARLGKEIQITEFDIDTIDQRLQADYTRDLLTAVFSHPSTTGFVMWGFWEGRHWKPNGAMYRRDWSAKPNAGAYEDLVLNRWWTNETVTTDAEGRCRVRGFLGDYDIEAKHGGAARRREVELSDGGTSVEIEL